MVDILDDADYLATPDTSHALATSSLLTKYLIERRGGLARFWALWSAVSLVGVEEAPEAVYGASWAELDRAMRAWLGILPGRG